MHKAERKQRLIGFYMERKCVTNKLTYSSWMNTNNKAVNKKKTFQFINA